MCEKILSTVHAIMDPLDPITWLATIAALAIVSIFYVEATKLTNLEDPTFLGDQVGYKDNDDN